MNEQLLLPSPLRAKVYLPFHDCVIRRVWAKSSQ